MGAADSLWVTYLNNNKFKFSSYWFKYCLLLNIDFGKVCKVLENKITAHTLSIKTFKQLLLYFASFIVF